MDTIAETEARWHEHDRSIPIASNVSWRINTGNRLWGGLITGRAASGKTTLLRRLAREAHGTGLNVHLVDPLGPKTLDGIEFYSHRLEDAAAILEWGEEEIAARLESEPAERESAPAQLIIIDHTEMVPHNRRNLRRIEHIARSGARLGVTVVLCGQLNSWWVPEGARQGNLLALPSNTLDSAIRIGIEQRVDPSTAHFADPVTGEITDFDPRI